VLGELNLTTGKEI